jgi:endonuclease YncB( thermonuclease family)
LGATPLPPAKAEPAGCSAEGAARAKIASINERLELTLTGGQELKIAGVDPPRPTPSDPDLEAKSREPLARWLLGKEILFRPLAGRPDRWGRLSALVFAPGEAPNAPLLAVAEALIDAGLARFDPNADGRLCRAALLAAEASARAAALGLWADPYYAVLPAAERESLAEKAGTFVIVEGKVASVDATGFRATLFFGPRRGWHFSVTILQRNIKLFDAAGLNLAQFAGQILRVRGLLDMRFGPQIEISSPDEIEVIAQGQDQDQDQAKGRTAIDPAPSRR